MEVSLTSCRSLGGGGGSLFLTPTGVTETNKVEGFYRVSQKMRTSLERNSSVSKSDKSSKGKQKPELRL